jgi:hypothetical protein
MSTKGASMTDIHSCGYYCDRPECIKAQRDELRDRLAQLEQPEVRTGNCLRVGVCASEGHKIQLQRTWVGLMDSEIMKIINSNISTGLWYMAIEIEAKLKEKNT